MTRPSLAALKRQQRVLRRAKTMARSIASKAGPSAISPLAPPGGFPDLPVVGGVTFAAASSGVKYKGRDDVMLALLAPGSTIAGTFTTSSTRSSNVLDCQAKLAANGNPAAAAAIIVNAGNSNAFTGKAGDGSVDAICHAVSAASGVPTARVFTGATGVIGERLPHEKIVSQVGDLVERQSPSAMAAVADAIRTTDTFAKGSGIRLEVDGRTVHIAGFAKGSGMIAPDMATMLVYIFTDAWVPKPLLQDMLGQLCDRTFNAITVDSDTSTSDSLMLAATGKSGAQISDTNRTPFETALEKVMKDLAQQVVRDGEGATKFVEVRVTSATTDADAKTVALAIANSPLVKTAIAGEDPNWGRIVMAVGKSGAPADRDRLTIHFGDVLVAENGWVSPNYTEAAGAAVMKGQNIQISVDMGLGSGTARVWTCDLTHGYISINADYRS